MARQRVVIDPLTRIEGHLRMEMEAERGKITDAWCEVTQFRGIETVVKDRDPRDVWTMAQRICGVCTAVHAVASIVAVEDALGYPPPEQAHLIRDLVLGNQIVQDHVIHFYHLQALDWVNIPSAAKGDAKAAVAFATGIGYLVGQLGGPYGRGQGHAERCARERPADHLHQRLLGSP